MTQNWVNIGWWLRPASFWAVVGMITLTECCVSAFPGNYALAQIVPDGTLGTEASIIAPNVKVNGLPSELIQGGASRGVNLFHSFLEFNVGRGQRVYFANPTGIKNILSRVTGTNPSDILGTLGVDGGANLFFLNPNGIVFGSDAMLDIKGSFVGTTASSIKFADGTEFRATAAQAAPLLSVSVTVPIGLQFGDNPGQILVQGSALNLSGRTNALEMTGGERIDERVTPIAPEVIGNRVIGSVENLAANIVGRPTVGLTVQPGRTLALVGGDVRLEGGQLRAPQGRIELGSVGGNSLVSLTPTPQGWALGYEGVQNFRDIYMSKQALVDASGLGGGEIRLKGNLVTLSEGSSIAAATLGNFDGGEIFIGAEQLNLESGSFVATFTQGTGKSANVTIETGNLTVRNSLIGSTSLGQGDSGNLTVKVADSVKLIGTTPDGRLPSGLFAVTGGEGAGGTLNVNTKQLVVRDGAQVAVATASSGRGGVAKLEASESIELIGESANRQFSSGIFASSYGAGDAGDLRIKTGRLTVRDGAGISATTRLSQGGKVEVSASDSIELIGTTADGRFESEITALAIGGENAGNKVRGGNVRIDTRNLTVRDGAQISAASFGAGRGGTVELNVLDSIELIGSGGSAHNPKFSTVAATSNGTGDSGNVTIETQRLIARDGADVSVSAFGNGKSGELIVRASESIELIGASTSPDGRRFSRSGLFAATEGIQDGGDLTVITPRLRVLDGARVSVSTRGRGQPDHPGGRGGNLTVIAPESVELSGTSADGRFRSGLFALSGEQRPNIRADEATGNGGNLSIKTGRLIVRDGAEVSVSAQGTGAAGNLEVIAGFINLDNGTIKGETASGEGGNIRLQVQDLLQMRHESKISTTAGTAQAGGNGGNIKIDAGDGFIIAHPAENSDIAANAFSGNGGRVEIRTQGIFGLEKRDRQTHLSDITATSTGGGIDGEVELNTGIIDPKRGLTNLEDEPVEIELAEGCQAGRGQASASFVNNRRGSSQPRPNDVFNSNAVTAGWIPLELGEKNGSEPVMALDSSQSNEETKKEVSRDEKRKVSSTPVPTAPTRMISPCWSH